MDSVNRAAWLLEPKGNVELGEAPIPVPAEDEIIIKNESIAIQPLDASILKLAYFTFQYPLILGNNVAGTITAAGSKVTNFAVGDRVVSDTPMYTAKMNKYGGWQAYVTSKAATTCKIPDSKSFDEAAVMSFSLLTVVAALSLKLGMPKKQGELHGKALIWGGSGAVGGYAVQFCESVGCTVYATASPRKADYVRELGATDVFDYNDPDTPEKLRSLGPFDYVMSATGDPKAATAVAQVLQPKGGRFVHLRPRNDSMDLPENVELLYNSFSLTTSRNDEPAFTRWWYDEYLPGALASGIKPTPFTRWSGGLRGLQGACDAVASGTATGKLVLNVQETS